MLQKSDLTEAHEMAEKQRYFKEKGLDLGKQLALYQIESTLLYEGCKNFALICNSFSIRVLNDHNILI